MADRRITTKKHDTDGATTVAKALEVLDLIADIGRPARFAELQVHSELPKGTLYRFLQTLTKQGLLTYDPDRKVYFLGMRLVRLAHAAWKQSSLAPVAQPHLDALAGLVRETIHLAQLDGGHVLYVDKLYPSRPVEMFSSAGKVGPAYCTGVGKAMLAYLAEEQLERALAQQSFYRFTDRTITTKSALLAELAAIRSAVVCIVGTSFSKSSKSFWPRSVVTDRPPSRWPRSVRIGTATQIMPRSCSSSSIAKPRLRIAADTENWRFPETNQCIQPMGT